MQKTGVIQKEEKPDIQIGKKPKKQYTNETHKEGVKGHKTNQIYKSVYFKSEYVLTHSEALYIPCTCTNTIL